MTYDLEWNGSFNYLVHRRFCCIIVTHRKGRLHLVGRYDMDFVEVALLCMHRLESMMMLTFRDDSPRPTLPPRIVAYLSEKLSIDLGSP